jgi:murein DD-endopeptidase MepM/ murein hydrolase activator NlpD
MADSRRGGSFEIVIHAADRRGTVLRLRLNRAWLTAGSVVVLLYCFFLAFAAGMAPGVVGATFGSQEYRLLASERARQGERLQALVERLDQLRQRSAALLLAVRKVSAAYDLAPALPGGPAGIAGAAAPAPGPAAAAGAAAAADEAASAGELLLGSGSIYAGTLQQGERLERRIDVEIRDLEAGLAAVALFERGHQDVVRDTPSACPLRGDRYVLTSPFGRQRSAFTRDFGFHAGIDLAAPRGTSIVAPADGVVTFAGTYPLARSAEWWRFGNLVAVAHGDRFVTLYGHCGDLKVRAGQAVRRGELLALVGSTGWSVSPHVHYEVRKRAADGSLVPVDPLIYILDRRWPNEQRQLARAGTAAPTTIAGGFEPLPPGLDRVPGRARR